MTLTKPKLVLGHAAFYPYNANGPVLSPEDLRLLLDAKRRRKRKTKLPPPTRSP